LTGTHGSNQRRKMLFYLHAISKTIVDEKLLVSLSYMRTKRVTIIEIEKN